MAYISIIKPNDNKKKTMELNLELYRNGDGYGIYLADNCGGSGIKVEGSTEKEVCEKLVPYLAEYFNAMGD